MILLLTGYFELYAQEERDTDQTQLSNNTSETETNEALFDEFPQFSATDDESVVETDTFNAQSRDTFTRLVKSGGLQLSAELNLYTILSKNALNMMDMYALGQGYIRFRGTDSRAMIRSELSLMGNFTNESMSLNIYRAFIRARIGHIFRITVGKAPLSWGEGVYYNAGDILFSHDKSAYIAQNDLNEFNTKWMTLINIGLNQFSFIELGLFAPPFSINIIPLPSFPSVEEMSIAARFQTKLWDIVQVQLGYAYTGESTYKTPVQPAHHMYTSVKSILFGAIDWYISASMHFFNQNNTWDTIRDYWQNTIGFHTGIVLNTANQARLNFQIEARLNPFGYWTEQLALQAYTVYAIELYAEAQLTINRFIISIRNIFSPIDISNIISLNFSVNIVQNLHFIAIGKLEFGDNSDIFSFEHAHGISLYIGARYIIQ